MRHTESKKYWTVNNFINEQHLVSQQLVGWNTVNEFNQQRSVTSVAQNTHNQQTTAVICGSQYSTKRFSPPDDHYVSVVY